MKRFWILMTGALPLAFATPTLAGNFSGYNGPIVYHQTHNPGFIGAGHRGGHTPGIHRIGYNGFSRHGRRGTLSQRSVRGPFARHRIHRGRALGHRIGLGHRFNRGRALGHQKHNRSYWPNYSASNPWFSPYYRGRNNNRFSDHDHSRCNARNGRGSHDRYHRGDHRGNHNDHDHDGDNRRGDRKQRNARNHRNR